MNRAYRFPLVLLLIVLWLLVGCTAHTLREAQDSFNKGAEIELRAIDRSWLSDNPNASPADALAALNSYRLANSLATKSIDKDSKTLKEDNLLGATYVLKAMSLWRISDLEGNQTARDEKKGAASSDEKTANTRQDLLATLTQIEQLQSSKEIVLGTRDRVLFKSLYGFYDHDGGRNERDYEMARDWFQSANRRLKESLSDVPPQHPIRVYVGSARLRTLAAWNQALYVGKRSLSDPDLAKKDQKAINEIATEVVCELRPFWEYNEDVKKSLVQLLSTMGQTSAINQCH